MALLVSKHGGGFVDTIGKTISETTATATVLTVELCSAHLIVCVDYLGEVIIRDACFRHRRAHSKDPAAHTNARGSLRCCSCC